MKKPVVECIEEATRCARKARLAENVEDVLKYLIKAEMWLEIAKYRAQHGAASVGSADKKH